MFKSCFPNSNLSGSPDDPPQEGYDYTVGNAKWVYNDLLNYFRTRPDKLFVVITAPPVQDPTYADNARAFNLWLMNDWLQENSYTLNNVVVFDFYNVLTHPDNHHRYNNGQIEYTTSHGNNTSAYPSEDDHPNARGSQKATDEFIPLLNIFYHRWQSGSAALPPATEAPAAGGEIEQPVIAPPSAGVGPVIDDFESGPPAGTDGWVAWWDEATQSTGSCAPEGGEPYSGSQALHITYSVIPESWLTCALIYQSAHDWSSGTGVGLYVRAPQTGLWFDVVVYSGTPDSRTSYMRSGLETTQEMVDGWGYIQIPWSELLGVDWEQNPGAPVDPAVVTGMAIGFGDTNAVSGDIWVDDIHLLGAEPVVIAPPPTEAPAVEPTQEPPAATPEPAEEEPAPEEEEESGGSRLPCASPVVMGLLVTTILLWTRRK
jgi:hypothetical protein